MFQPETIGRYLLLRKLAVGGMAEIYLGKLEGVAGFEKYVVIKKILPQWSADPEFISMLIDEAKIVVQLTHSSIAQVYELGREENHYYIAMEYVQGVDLRKLLAKCQALKKKIPLEIALFMMCEVLDGLGYAHAKRDSQGNFLEIIHRDISPQNILVSMEGAVKLTDFGIAKAASRHQETMTGVLKGKFAYMSPEQANQEPMDHRSDLYAVAIVLYEILTQERLFYKGTDLDTLDRVRRGQITFSENAEKIIPKRLQEILLKALSLKVEDRYLDAYSFRDDLLVFARRFKKILRREKVSEFICELFADEIQSEMMELVNETRLMKEKTVSKVQESTKTSGAPEVPQILATRVMDEARPPRHLWYNSFSRKDRSRFFAFLSVILSATIALYFFIESEPPQPVIKQPPINVHPVKTPTKPPEVIGKVSERNVLKAPESIPFEKQTPPENPIVVSPKLNTKTPLIVREKKGEGTDIGYLSVMASPWGFVRIDGGDKRWETPLKKMPLNVGRHLIEVFYEPESLKVGVTIQITMQKEKTCVAKFSKKEKRMKCD